MQRAITIHRDRQLDLAIIAICNIATAHITPPECIYAHMSENRHATYILSCYRWKSMLFIGQLRSEDDKMRGMGGSLELMEMVGGGTEVAAD